MKQGILRLNRIITNNWGTSQHVDIECRGNVTMLIGANGAGKTTLIDAYQAVCYGSFESRFYNLAQRDGDSRNAKRTALEYLRGATKHHGKLRGADAFNAGVIVEWYDEEKARYFCSGAIFEISSRETSNVPEHRWFTLNGPAPEDKFRNYGYEDIERLTKERAQMYENERPMVSKTYRNDQEYRTNLYDKVFGGVSYENFKRLQRAAISMKMDGTTEQFIRDFLFPSDPPEVVKNLSESVHSYRVFQRKMEHRAKEIDALKNVVKNIEEYRSSKNNLKKLLEEKECVMQSVLTDKKCQHEERIAAEEQKIRSLDKKRDELEEREQYLTEQLDDAHRREGQNDYSKLMEKIKDEQTKLEFIQKRIKSIDALKERLRQWIDDSAVEQFIPDEVYDVLAKIYNNTASLEEIESLCKTLKTAREEIESAEKEAYSEQLNAEARLKEARKKLRDVQNDRRNYKTERVFDAVSFLHEKLSEKAGCDVKVDILSRLFDVKDVEWKDAIEARLTQKESIVVPPEHAVEASRILRRNTWLGVHLVDTRKMVDEPVEAKKNSLYECVSNEEDYVDATLKYYLGRIIKCDTEEELSRSGNGVTKDCFSYSGREYRHLPERDYTKYASIGKKITQEEIEKAENECTKAEGLWREKAQECEKLRNANRYIIPSASEVDELAENRILIQKQEECGELITRLKKEAVYLKDRDYKKIEEEIQKLESERKQCRKEQKVAAEAKQEAVSVKARLESLLDGVTRSLDRIQKDNSDGFTEEVVAAAMSWRSENKRIVSEEGVTNFFAPIISEAEEAHREKQMLKLKEKTTYARSFTTQIDDTDATDDDAIAAYEKMKSEYDESWLQKFNKLHEDAVESLRHNLVGALHDNLLSAQRTQSDINRYLKKNPFGNSIYRLEIQKAKGEEGDYYNMLMSESLDNVVTAQDTDQMHLGEKEFVSQNKELLDRFLAIFDTPEKRADESEAEFKYRQAEQESRARKYSDYRTYLRFSLTEYLKTGEESNAVSVEESAGKDSGGEKETSKYVAIFAGFKMLYKREPGRNVTPAVIFCDESFRKLDITRSTAVIEYLKALGLQIVLCAPDKDKELAKLATTVVALQAQNEVLHCYTLSKSEMRSWYGDEEPEKTESATTLAEVRDAA